MFTGILCKSREAQAVYCKSAAGLAALIYFSKVFNPDRTPADPQAAAAQQYSNAKTGVWALIVVYLGAAAVSTATLP